MKMKQLTTLHMTQESSVRAAEMVLPESLHVPVSRSVAAERSDRKGSGRPALSHNSLNSLHRLQNSFCCMFAPAAELCASEHPLSTRDDRLTFLNALYFEKQLYGRCKTVFARCILLTTRRGDGSREGQCGCRQRALCPCTQWSQRLGAGQWHTRNDGSWRRSASPINEVKIVAPYERVPVGSKFPVTGVDVSVIHNGRARALLLTESRPFGICDSVCALSGGTCY